MLDKLSQAIYPLIDSELIHSNMKIKELFNQDSAFWKILNSLKGLGKDVPEFYEIMTSPVAKILDRWFKSDILKATLATDSVVGAFSSPYSPGSGYVLLHHVMGEVGGQRGAWGYIEGGMGGVSKAIANSATTSGVEIMTNAEVQIKNGKAVGVVLKDGR